MSLAGHVALVTGSSRNLGRAVALALARAGASVATHGFTDAEGAEETARLVRETGATAIAVMGDVADPGEVRAMVERATAALGTIDVLVSCPGLRPEARTVDVTADEWKRVMGTNLEGPLWCAQALLPGMLAQGWGRIVNIAGTGAFTPEEDQPHVASSKAGLVGLTRSLSRDHARHGVLTNMVSPGLLHTEDSPYRSPGRDYEAMAERIPTGKVTEPEEVAALCTFLCQPEQRSITGQTIHINGGSYFG